MKLCRGNVVAFIQHTSSIEDNKNNYGFSFLIGV